MAEGNSNNTGRETLPQRGKVDKGKPSQIKRQQKIIFWIFNSHQVKTLWLLYYSYYVTGWNYGPSYCKLRTDATWEAIDRIICLQSVYNCRLKKTLVF